jgi:hypothetical protein
MSGWPSLFMLRCVYIRTRIKVVQSPVRLLPRSCYSDTTSNVRPSGRLITGRQETHSQSLQKAKWQVPYSVRRAPCTDFHGVPTTSPAFIALLLHRHRTLGNIQLHTTIQVAETLQVIDDSVSACRKITPDRPRSEIRSHIVRLGHQKRP